MLSTADLLLRSSEIAARYREDRKRSFRSAGDEGRLVESSRDAIDSSWALLQALPAAKMD